MAALRMLDPRVVALALVLSASSIPAVGQGAVPIPACSSASYASGLGIVCETEDGAYELYDKAGEALGLSHGLDPVPQSSAGSTGGGGGPLPEKAPPACKEPQAGYPIVVIYARSHEHEDGYEQKADEIRDLVGHANGYIREAGVATGALVDLTVLCEGDETAVAEAVLPTDADHADFSTIVSDLKDQGYDDGTKKYWVFYDDTSLGGGAANIHNDDRPTQDNAHNGNIYPMFAVNFGHTGNAGAKIMMHELAHTLGAVQHSAPHSTGAFHCTDGLDIMCYNDGGPDGGEYSNGPCPDAAVFDCGNDDYFNATPGPGSHLETHWNLAGEANRYTQIARVKVTDLTCPENTTTGEEVLCSFSGDAPPGSQVHYMVDWGDGDQIRIPREGTTDPTATQEATHTYTLGGDRTITVQITDDHGLTAVDTTGLLVDQGPIWESLSCPSAVLVETAFECTLLADHPEGLRVHYDLSWKEGESLRIPGNGTVPAGQEQNFTHTLPERGDHPLEAVVTDEDGIMHRVTAIVKAVSGPSLTLLDCPGTTQTGAAFECTFQATSEDDSPLSYRVEWGDGNTTRVPHDGTSLPGENQSVEHAFEHTGDHAIIVEVTDANGFQDQAATLAQAFHGPQIHHLECDGPAHPGETVSCSFQAGSGDGARLTYRVDWGDGNMTHVPQHGDLRADEMQDANHAYDDTGGYTVHVEVTDENGFTHEASVPLTIGHGPEITLLDCAGPVRLGTPASCTFEATSPDDTNVSYLLEWGDGQSIEIPDHGYLGADEAQTLEHPYDEAGDLLVSLRVSDENQLTETATTTIEVRHGPEIPQIDCPGPVRVDTALECTFQAISEDGSQVRYQVDWGDGNSTWIPEEGHVDAGEDQRATHAYARAGDPTVRLSVTDPDGFSSNTTIPVQVRHGPEITQIDCPPAVLVDTALECTFQAISEDGSQVRYQVDWGDGNSTWIPEEGHLDAGQDQRASHTYARAGDHTVHLLVADEEGLGYNTTVFVGVFHGPTLDPILCDGPVIEQTPFTCTVNASSPDGLDVSYQLEWGDGTRTRLPEKDDLPAGDEQSTTHLYPQAGPQTLIVNVTDAQGFTDRRSLLIQVHHRPELEFLSCPTETHLGDPFECSFRATSEEGTEVTYTIDWGDGRESLVPHEGAVPANETRTQAHDYGSVGNRTITVSVTDTNGGTDSSQIQVSVYQDVTPPEIEVLRPEEDMIYQGCGTSTQAAWQTAPVFVGQGCVEAVVIDDRSDVEEVKLYFDGSLVAQETGGGHHRFEFMIPGQYVAVTKTLEVHSTDSRGNSATTSFHVIVYG